MWKLTVQSVVLSVVRYVFMFGLGTVLVLGPPGASQAMAQTVERDPQALKLIASSLNAITAGVTVNDVVLQANASYFAGSDQESGTATLTALGNQESLVQLGLNEGPREELRNGPAGVWSGPDGTVHWMATHNCWIDANWFFPALTLEALQTDPTLGVVYVGPVVWNGVPAVGLQFFHIIPGQTTAMTAEIQNLSNIYLYLDPKSFLPLALDFNTHLPSDLNAIIPVEIQFANYQSASGVLVPFSIQKFQLGSLILALTLTQATVNTTVPPSTFTLPPPPTGGAQ